MKTYSLALLVATVSAISINVSSELKIGPVTWGCDFDDHFEDCRLNIMNELPGIYNRKTVYENCVEDALDSHLW